MIGVAFGSTYYHLKPDNHRVIWDTLPVSICITITLQQNKVGVFTDTGQPGQLDYLPQFEVFHSTNPPNLK
jgi:hypothetical protein